MTNARTDDRRAVELATIGLSNVAIADMLNVDESTVRRALKREDFKRHLVPVDIASRFFVSLDEPLVLKDIDAMVTADWHIPLYDPLHVNRMIEKARELDINVLVIAGDFWNFDALSQYDPKQETANLAVEYTEGLAVMNVLLETFERIIYIWGNHDWRLAKSLGHALKFAESMKLMFGALGHDLLKRIEFSNLDHLWMVYGEPLRDPVDRFGRELELWERYVPEDRWYICHPRTYSRTPLANPRTLTTKVEANVITAHAHHCAIGYGPQGSLVAAEAGGLFDRRKTEYLKASTTYPCWTPGFGWMQGGRFKLTSPLWDAD